MEKWGHTVVKTLVDIDTEKIHGVIIQVDNGDSEYLTTEEYQAFLEKNQNKEDEAIY